MIQIAPGDPVYLLAGEGASEEFIEQTRHRFGLDKPLHIQLLAYVIQMFQGNLGRSYWYKQPVLDLILGRVGYTVILCSAGLALAFSLGTLMGLLAAYWPLSSADKSITTMALLGYSFPTFWIGILLILFFSIFLDCFPVTGMLSAGLTLDTFSSVPDFLWHLFLPTLTIAAWHFGIITRLTRTNLLGVLSEDYIVTARSKGLSRREVIIKHALKNASLPVITYVGFTISMLASGAVMTETIFSWPGIGRLLYNGIRMRDYPVVLGTFVFISLSVVIINTVTDILCKFLDPRIRYR